MCTRYIAGNWPYLGGICCNGLHQIWTRGIVLPWLLKATMTVVIFVQTTRINLLAIRVSPCMNSHQRTWQYSHIIGNSLLHFEIRLYILWLSKPHITGDYVHWLKWRDSAISLDVVKTDVDIVYWKSTSPCMSHRINKTGHYLTSCISMKILSRGAMIQLI